MYSHDAFIPQLYTVNGTNGLSENALQNVVPVQGSIHELNLSKKQMVELVLDSLKKFKNAKIRNVQVGMFERIIFILSKTFTNINIFSQRT